MRLLLTMLGIAAIAFPIQGDGNDIYKDLSSASGIDPNAGQNSFYILSIPGGGKYEGMATAHTAVALDGGYLESNPAGGSFLPKTILSFSHLDWIADSGLETITFAFRPEKNEDFGIGFSTKFLHIPFVGYNPWGAQYDRHGSSAVGWYTELLATAAVSYNFLRSFYFGGVSIGASLKAGYRGVSSALEPNQGAPSLMGDFGIMTRFNALKAYVGQDMNSSVGITIKNLGAEFINNPDPLPSSANIGLSYKPARPIILALDLNIPFNLSNSTPGKVSAAFGVNAEIAEFLSAHTGILIKTGKPRFAIGADIILKDFSIQTNYTFDLASRPELFDRMSIAIKLNMDMAKQLLLRDDALAPYLKGLTAYSEGNLPLAISYFENAISLDPSFTPAVEMLATARASWRIEEELSQPLGF